MANLIYFFVFLFGLAWGSFLNVVVYRLNHDRSPLRGRSYCPKCRHRLAWLDNLPLLSFVWLRGRCRYCRRPISWQYPLVELGTGLVWLLLVWRYGWWPWPRLLYNLAVSWLLVGITASDLVYRTIPDHFSVPLLALGLAGVFWRRDPGGLAVGLLLGLFFYLLHRLTRRQGMGLGDVRLVPSFGWLLGAKGALVAIYLAFISGALVSIFLLAAGRKKFGQKIAFGPFLVLGLALSFWRADWFLALWRHWFDWGLF